MIKVSDYVAEWLAGRGIERVFMITGGGAMHLNMSLGRRLKCVFNHHEQACAVAAESYARLTGKIAAVCVTSGPGGTNALTGVLGGWLDSIPMMIISGQVKRETTVRSTGLPLRQLGDQEFDIAAFAAPITKYSVMVAEPEEIAFHLEKAFFLATTGRPGPVWVDVPLDVQAAIVDERKLKHFRPEKTAFAPPSGAAKKIISRIKSAERPAILAGTGVRLAGAREDFLRLAELLNAPVLTAWNAHDLVPSSHALCMGRPGTVGDRPGNFIVQNCDLLLSIGCRLNVRQIGYNRGDFARNAYKIICDIDPVELKKPTIAPDMAVNCGAAELIKELLRELGGKKLGQKKPWLDWCSGVKRKYPVLTPAMLVARGGPVNPYRFVKELSAALSKRDVVVAGNGSACVVTFQAFEVKDGQRLYANSGCAAMGYDLPAALGAACSGLKRVVCLAGEGSFQMNIQELQTIVHNKLPVKIFILNNCGYHSIRQTQRNFFGCAPVGCSPESGVSFPDAEKISRAYGIPFFRCKTHETLRRIINKTLASKGPAICEMILDPEQGFEPRSASRALADGRIVSAPLEDMFPFLGRSELRGAMFPGVK